MDELSVAVSTLCKYLREDMGYFETWKANIAVAFQDEYNRMVMKGLKPEPEDIHGISNKAAEEFLQSLTRIV